MMEQMHTSLKTVQVMLNLIDGLESGIHKVGLIITAWIREEDMVQDGRFHLMVDMFGVMLLNIIIMLDIIYM